MSLWRNFRWVAGALIVSCPCMVHGADGKPVKVFILAGQSNMEGQVKRELLEVQASAPQTKALFTHLREGDVWIERDDVFIKFLNRKGPLTIGYGARGSTGVELEFGHVIGGHFTEPVLLIKTAWGGRSLVKDFRPPSAGMPEERIRREIERATRRVEEQNLKNHKSDPPPSAQGIRAEYGRSYRGMMDEIRGTLAGIGELFPALKGCQPEISGFVWFQGWNDQYDGAEKEYQANLECLIRDIRNDLGKPGLPVVVGMMGQNMSREAKGAMKEIQQAQAAMEKVPAFVGNVKVVRTDVLVDKEAEALYPKWRENPDEWRKTGSDHPYHYLGSAIWHLRMGRAFAEAMIALQPAMRP